MGIRHEREVDAFYEIINNIRRGVCEAVSVHRWKTVYNKLCAQMGLYVVSIRERYGYLTYFICKTEDMADKIKKSRYARELMIGNVTPKGRIEIGNLLGMPPKATKAYAYKSYPESTQIKIEYQGIKFISFEATYIDDMKWLMAKVKPKIKG